MIEFFNTFSIFLYDFISYICTSYIGYLVGGLLVIGSLFAMLYRMANRRY